MSTSHMASFIHLGNLSVDSEDAASVGICQTSRQTVAFTLQKT